jgi:hypothetical protein
LRHKQLSLQNLSFLKHLQYSLMHFEFVQLQKSWLSILDSSLFDIRFFFNLLLLDRWNIILFGVFSFSSKSKFGKVKTHPLLSDFLVDSNSECNLDWTKS